MAKTIEQVRVIMADDNFYPQAFRWSGRVVRVLFVEGMRTSGAERLFRVRTVEGTYELAEHTSTQSWTLRRRPWWWERALGQGADAARYEPAPGRVRISRIQARAQAQARAETPARAPSRGREHTRTEAREHAAQANQSTDGGDHASGLAVVR